MVHQRNRLLVREVNGQSREHDAPYRVALAGVEYLRLAGFPK